MPRRASAAMPLGPRSRPWPARQCITGLNGTQLVGPLVGMHNGTTGPSFAAIRKTPSLRRAHHDDLQLGPIQSGLLQHAPNARSRAALLHRHVLERVQLLQLHLRPTAQRVRRRHDQAHLVCLVGRGLARAPHNARSAAHESNRDARESGAATKKGRLPTPVPDPSAQHCHRGRRRRFAEGHAQGLWGHPHLWLPEDSRRRAVTPSPTKEKQHGVGPPAIWTPGRAASPHPQPQCPPPHWPQPRSTAPCSPPVAAPSPPGASACSALRAPKTTPLCRLSSSSHCGDEALSRD
jgi:hypothetical protein